MKAIDLYAGIGGWALGLKLAGIEVVRSFEWWQPAVDTHNHNLGGDTKPSDCRKIDLDELPDGIELVVGSPPCTEFSYSNRGGNGDLAEGLKDLLAFFRVVDHVQPKYWVMENVPRVAEVLAKGFADPDHPLNDYAHLGAEIHVFDMSEFGAPQARRRCIAGNIPFELLQRYAEVAGRRTLGDVVQALSQPVVVDPVWGVQLSDAQVTEMEREAPLNKEERRMNCESKVYHPVYNNMAFPDRMDEPARTVTATCTRVSRESIVIEDPKRPGTFRRLTVRERASLQGFPITYQFYGSSFAEKAKMVGNAIPPTFTYLVARAVQAIQPEELPGFCQAGRALELPTAPAKPTPPDTEGRSYPQKRNFRSALPHLRFKSGMRFDLSNSFAEGEVSWRVGFYFGPSKAIREVDLDGELLAELTSSSRLVSECVRALRDRFDDLQGRLRSLTPERLQLVWTHRAQGFGPFELTDELGALADEVHAHLVGAGAETSPAVAELVLKVADDGEIGEALPSQPKLRKNAVRILSGYVVGSWFNQQFATEAQRIAA